MRTAIKWTARSLGTFLFCLYLLFVIGEGPPPLVYDRLLPAVQRYSLFLSLAGIPLAWKWEGWGGALVLAGIGGFYGAQYAGYHNLPGGPVFPMFFVAGILFILSWWMGRKKP